MLCRTFLRGSLSRPFSTSQPNHVKVRSLAPGLAASFAILGAASAVSTSVFASALSPVPIAVACGVVAAALISPQSGAVLKPGAKFASTTLLRAGIVCVGAKLSLAEIAANAAVCLPVVVPTMAVAIGTAVLGARVLGLHRDFAVLMAAGTGICGVTAISTVGPVIGAAEQYVAVAVANVIVFGLLGMLLYPLLAHTAFFPSNDPNNERTNSPDSRVDPSPSSTLSAGTKAGLFLGVSIHDSSQVLGAAMSFRDVYNNEEAFNVAAITKLTRNLLLVAAVPLLAILHRRMGGTATTSAQSAAKMPPLFPSFVLGFLGMAALRSLGDYLTAHSNVSADACTAWNTTHKFVGDTVGSKLLLGTAMAGLGLGTSLSVLAGVGWRPFAVGGFAAASAACTGYLMIQLLDKCGWGR